MFCRKIVAFIAKIYYTKKNEQKQGKRRKEHGRVG